MKIHVSQSIKLMKVSIENINLHFILSIPSSGSGCGTERGIWLATRQRQRAGGSKTADMKEEDVDGAARAPQLYVAFSLVVSYRCWLRQHQRCLMLLQQQIRPHTRFSRVVLCRDDRYEDAARRYGDWASEGLLAPAQLSSVLASYAEELMLTKEWSGDR